MGISLSKGQNISLDKVAPGLVNALVGLGWDARATSGAAFDLDAQALLLDTNGKVLNGGEGSFIFYNQLSNANGSVVHKGDNLTGSGDGDDEQIHLELANIPADVDKIVFSVSIHDADARQQTFGQVRNAFVRVVNEDTGEEIARYDLSEDASTDTAVNFAEVYRNNNEWKFKAIGQGYSTGLAGLATDFGVQLG